MIDRQIYMDKLLRLKDKQIIKIITGVRRCGKSTLLSQFKEYLLKQNVNNKQIFHINLDLLENKKYLDVNTLYSYIADNLVDGKRNYVMLDEIQLVDEYERAINSLFNRDNVDVYVTGSNAKMLSSEIATLLSGRYIEISMLPLSFTEYVSGAQKDKSRLDLYYDYLDYSSFPYAMELDNDPIIIKDYLDGILNTVLLKDVVARNKISDVMMLENLVEYLFDNIGNLTSTKKISDTMTSAGRKISVPTVESYISALLDSYIIYKAKRYDIKGKQYLKTNDKYYIVDLGMRKNLLGTKPGDEGFELENVIYLELIRRGCEVYIGKVGEYEVDFVTIEKGERVYYQVSLNTSNKDVLERELRPLKQIKDSFPKYLLTLDNSRQSNIDGIVKMNALDFLLKND